VGKSKSPAVRGAARHQRNVSNFGGIPTQLVVTAGVGAGSEFLLLADFCLLRAILSLPSWDQAVNTSAGVSLNAGAPSRNTCGADCFTAFRVSTIRSACLTISA